MESPHPMRRTPLDNDRGMALILAIFLLLFIAIFGMVGITISNREIEGAGSQHLAEQNLYQAQAGLDESLLISDTWLTNSFLMHTPMYNAVSFTHENGLSGQHIADITARYIQDKQAEPNLPSQPHYTEPPAGSGYSVGKFIVRRFAVQADYPDKANPKSIVLEGVWRVFNSN